MKSAVFPKISELRQFIQQNRDLEPLLSGIKASDAEFWLVGGCLRNFLLNLPQTDIDIACSADPTPLAKTWAAEVGGHWFWLDKARKQSRVMLSQGLIVDFNPLKAETIDEDLRLRDFTINSFGLLLNSFPDAPFVDLLSGIDHLNGRQLKACSPQSLVDDPLRILKGIRHAVTLDFAFDPETWQEICTSAHLLSGIAGERVHDELSKILSSPLVGEGIKLLYESGVLEVLFGPAGRCWDVEKEADLIANLYAEMQKYPEIDSLNLETFEHYSVREIILFAQLIRVYLPADLTQLLHSRLRFSRRVQRIMKELQREPNLEFFTAVKTSDSRRRQALLVEQLEPFSSVKMLYWGVCFGRLDFSLFKELQTSFATQQQSKRIPDLLGGKRVLEVLGNVSPAQIGSWQSRVKLAEIKGEISSSADAENWLKDKLLFDNKEV